jgi:hypothetical protein
MPKTEKTALSAAVWIGGLSTVRILGGFKNCKRTLRRELGLASFYDAPRLQAFFRCIPSVLPGDRLPAPSMPEAVSYCADLVLDRQRPAPWR